MADALGVTRVGDLGKDFQQAKGSGQDNRLLPGGDRPRLPSVPSSANIKVRTALGAEAPRMGSGIAFPPLSC
jgi:hypothetical protein